MTIVIETVPPPAPAFAGPDPRPLLRRAKELIAAERFGAVRPLLAALDKIEAEPVAVAELRAIWAVRENRLDDAEAGLDAAIAAWPGKAALYRRRAEIRALLSRYGDAARDAAEAVMIDPADPVGRAQLGFNLLLLGHLDQACACLTDAVDRAPAAAPFRQALADAQEQSGRPELAERTLADGIALAPHARKLRNRLATLHIGQGAWSSVLDVSEAARRDGVADAELFSSMGQALIHLGRHAEAAGAYAEALKLAPEDKNLRKLVAMLQDFMYAEAPAKVSAGALTGASNAE